MSKLRLIFIDGNEVTRALFGYVLEGSSGIEVVGEAADHRSAMALIRQYGPDAIIIGYDLPPSEESQLRHNLGVEFPQTEIIELSELNKTVTKRLTQKVIRQFPYSRMVH